MHSAKPRKKVMITFNLLLSHSRRLCHVQSARHLVPALTDEDAQRLVRIADQATVDFVGRTNIQRGQARIDFQKRGSVKQNEPENHLAGLPLP